MKYNKFLEDLELIDSDHKNFSIETPLREDAFDLSDDDKIKIIKKNVGEILHTLGMDMTDDSLKGTPLRVAKAYVKELFGGLNPKNLPKGSTFENKYKKMMLFLTKCSSILIPCWSPFGTMLAVLGEEFDDCWGGPCSDPSQDSF